MSRPSVSVIVPFRGSTAELEDTVSRLGAIELQDGDELVIVWNSSDAIPELESSLPQLQILPAPAEASSYYARNVGVRSSRNSWLLFVDGDCVPSTGILGSYFAQGEPPADVGIIAGGIVAVPGETVVERYATARDHLSQQRTLSAKPLGYGQTANLLVGRHVWDTVHGFAEGINSGGDADLCWRARYVGVKLAYEPSAFVSHRHRRSVGALWKQHVKYGRGQRWLTSRHLDAGPKGPPIVLCLRALMRLPLAVARGNPERVRFAFLDLLSWLGLCVGWFRTNAAVVTLQEPTP